MKLFTQEINTLLLMVRLLCISVHMYAVKWHLLLRELHLANPSVLFHCSELFPFSHLHTFPFIHLSKSAWEYGQGIWVGLKVR